MFKIQVNNGAIQRHQMTKEVAKPPARTLLRDKSRGAIVEIDAEGSAYVKGFKLNDPWWKGRIDIKEAVKNAKAYLKDYERTLPEKLSPETESQMWVRAKQLKDEFVQGMLSREELHPVKGFTSNGTVIWVVDEEKLRSLNSVERNVAWEKRNAHKITEFKNIMRHLDPDNPNAGDVEKFRPRLQGVR